MFLCASDSFASWLTALAVSLPHVASLQPGIYHAADGTTYYYGIYRLVGDTMNRHTPESPCPLTAYRDLQICLLLHRSRSTAVASVVPDKLPAIVGVPTYLGCSPEIPQHPGYPNAGAWRVGGGLWVLTESKEAPTKHTPVLAAYQAVPKPIDFEESSIRVGALPGERRPVVVLPRPVAIT